MLTLGKSKLRKKKRDDIHSPKKRKLRKQKTKHIYESLYKQNKTNKQKGLVGRAAITKSLAEWLNRNSFCQPWRLEVQDEGVGGIAFF